MKEESSRAGAMLMKTRSSRRVAAAMFMKRKALDQGQFHFCDSSIAQQKEDGVRPVCVVEFLQQVTGKAINKIAERVHHSCSRSITNMCWS